jgi:hypothetical protein
VSLMILDGERLYFSVARGDNPPTTFGGVNIRHPRACGRARHHEGVGRLEPEQVGEAIRPARTKTEVDLSRIAHELGDRLPRA